MASKLPKTAQARKPQCTNDCASAVWPAASVCGCMPANSGGGLAKCIIGSAAAQKAPPPASRAHMITAIQLKVLVSGRRSTPPSRTRPHLLKQMNRLMAKVASIRICQYKPKNFVDQANNVFTSSDTPSMSTRAAIRKAPRKPPLIRNSGQSMFVFGGARSSGWTSPCRVSDVFMMPPKYAPGAVHRRFGG
ncbi:hypothetical protein D3C76_885930 [compost metagenome]